MGELALSFAPGAHLLEQPCILNGNRCLVDQCFRQLDMLPGKEARLGLVQAAQADDLVTGYQRHAEPGTHICRASPVLPLRM